MRGAGGAGAVDRTAFEDVAVLHHRVSAIAEGMGSALIRASSGTNIKERRDLSCATFDAKGRLLAQAAHIPVHLGALPAAVAAANDHVDRWRRGDVVLLNDPYLGGSHLPDLTTVSPAFVPRGDAPVGFVATRAHHADVGGGAPGSLMAARDLYGEGLILPPVHLVRAGRRADDVIAIVCANSRTPIERRADLGAQLAAQRLGADALARLIATTPGFAASAEALLAWSARLCRSRLRTLGDGRASFQDALDDDGVGGGPLGLQVAVTLADGRLHADFAGTASQADGGLNAPIAVTLSAARYVAACLVGDVPLNDGAFAHVSVTAPLGSLVNPIRPAAVAAGNVETSQRIVDVLFGALAVLAPDRVPAAGHGTMNNLLIGGSDARRGRAFAYYETMGGGGGGGPAGPGASGLQTHMTNTRNTPIESIELAYPLRVERYALRRGSGGQGKHCGGDGVVRRVRLLEDASVTVVSERRVGRPWGLAGGDAGMAGVNRALYADGGTETLPGKTTRQLRAGDAIEIASPGGGGWGATGPGRAPLGGAPVGHAVQDEREHEHPGDHVDEQGPIPQQDVLRRTADAAHLDQVQVA